MNRSVGDRSAIAPRWLRVVLALISAAGTGVALYLAWDANSIAREAVETQKSEALRRSADRVSFTSKREGTTVKIVISNLSTELMFDPQIEVASDTGTVTIVRLRDLEPCRSSHFRVDGKWWNVKTANLVFADGRGANWARAERKEVQPRERIDRTLKVNQATYDIATTEFRSRGQWVVDRYRDPKALSVGCA
ncbi:MAG TPA: hypothetical protein VIT41_00685 [Microlunatus sp.]